MECDHHDALGPGSPVVVLRSRNGTEGETQGIAATGDGDALIGLRLAGSPCYSEGETAVLIDQGSPCLWAVEAAYTGRERDVAFFRRVGTWYRFERRATPRYATSIRVTVTSPAGAYIERGMALDMSEGGLRVFVPSEPEERELNVIMPYQLDGIVLLCHLVRLTYRDDGVELHLAFHELDAVQSRYVHKRVAEIRTLAEQGRDLIERR